MFKYTLNDAGQQAIDKFIAQCARDEGKNLKLPAFYEEAHDQANGLNGNGFDDGCTPTLELSQHHSWRGRPEILRLNREFFDAE